MENNIISSSIQVPKGANRARLAIVYAMANWNPRTIPSLSDELRIGEQDIAAHLVGLAEAGIVEVATGGEPTRYQIRPAIRSALFTSPDSE